MKFTHSKFKIKNTWTFFGKERKLSLPRRHVNPLYYCFFWGCLLGNGLILPAQEKSDGMVQNNKPIWANSEWDQSAVYDYINLYQKFISGNRGSVCAMYPSCSNYGIKVFNERPFYEAMLLTADRLVRCSHDRTFYDRTFQFNQFRLLDYPPYEKAPVFLVDKTSSPVKTGQHRNDSTLWFIETLINKEEYTLALLEIERVSFFQNRTEEIFFYNKLLCYEALNREEDAIYEYEMRLPDSLQSSKAINLKMATLALKLENYAAARSFIEKVVCSSNPNSDALSKAYAIEGLLYTKEKMYSKAQLSFEKANMAYPRPEVLLNNHQILEELIRFSPKKRSTAQLLSVVPGLGYVYTGQAQNALASLVINSLLGYATYTSIQSKNYGVAGIMGVLSLSFYCGNMLGAGQSAKKYNTRFTSRKINQLNQNNLFIHY